MERLPIQPLEYAKTHAPNSFEYGCKNTQDTAGPQLVGLHANESKLIQ